MLIEATGETLYDYIDRELFSPLGITETGWKVRRSGDHYGGIGMSLRPRDMAKIGQLALQGGFWKDRQVVAEEWIRVSTSDRVADPFTGYGFQWWVVDADRFTAIGYGGQYVLVDRANDLVLVQSANWNVDSENHISYSEFDQLQDLLRSGLMTESQGGFSVEPEVAVGEGEGSAEIFVERTGGSDGAVALSYRTEAGSADAGQDFLESTGSLRWEHGESGKKSLLVGIVNDTTSEATEALQIVLGRLSGSADVDNATVTVRIADDDESGPVVQPLCADGSQSPTWVWWCY